MCSIVYNTDASFMNFMFFWRPTNCIINCIVEYYILIFWQNKVMMMMIFKFDCELWDSSISSSIFSFHIVFFLRSLEICLIITLCVFFVCFWVVVFWSCSVLVPKPKKTKNNKNTRFYKPRFFSPDIVPDRISYCSPVCTHRLPASLAVLTVWMYCNLNSIGLAIFYCMYVCAVLIHGL